MGVETVVSGVLELPHDVRKHSSCEFVVPLDPQILKVKMKYPTSEKLACKPCSAGKAQVIADFLTKVANNSGGKESWDTRARSD